MTDRLYVQCISKCQRRIFILIYDKSVYKSKIPKGILISLSNLHLIYTKVNFISFSRKCVLSRDVACNVSTACNVSMLFKFKVISGTFDGAESYRSVIEHLKIRFPATRGNFYPCSGIYRTYFSCF